MQREIPAPLILFRRAVCREREARDSCVIVRVAELFPASAQRQIPAPLMSAQREIRAPLILFQESCLPRARSASFMCYCEGSETIFARAQRARGSYVVRVAEIFPASAQRENCIIVRVAELYPCERAARASFTLYSSPGCIPASAKREIRAPLYCSSGAVCRERAARAVDT
jgi:hypothetical protein